ncbi:MAG: FAD-binding oxidoreductase [Moorea sp. SIO3I7]|uniref:FAD-binding oxidoreductase n=1 Tax=unclassified Moorena TaxID=2683338 RepID=UPI0013C1C156|nr:MULTISPECIES: FAD-binding oxidoreductase [unclassified Moorena]NEN96912.1 FAD-binding oxidoreductase [Moorena sp. SIO3I7]NEO04189.1 FAD-binding oxidoreductase [Moorena sp. SIO3I8]NEP20827.1 FAD-binding oxidoreductase [Moorena sp. SIO3I6]
MNAIASTLEPIVENSNIYTWENLDPSWQERIKPAIAPDTLPKSIIYPSTPEQLAQVIGLAHSQHYHLLPCGNGSKLGWGGIGKDIDVVVSTKHLNQIIDHAVGDLTVTVEAGVKLADLQAILSKTGQFLALDPANPQEATIGGIIATADSGSLSQRYGGVRDMLLGISFVRSDGQIAKAGGRVVKNVAGYDLMKLFTGSYGTLGIITQATFRLYPIPQAAETIVLTGEMDGIASAVKTVLASALTPTALDLLSPKLVTELGIGQEMGLMVRFQSVADSVKEQCARIQSVAEQLGLRNSFYSNGDDTSLWESLANSIGKLGQSSTIVCKIGVLPTAAAKTLNTLESLGGLGLIHVRSGLGKVWFESQAVSSEMIKTMRNFCKTEQGFMTVLEAPITLKQELDVWGYQGNGLEVMRGIKQKFDPENVLSPGRFIGGI